MIRIMTLLVLIFTLFAFAIDSVLAEPLGGWGTFKGPVAECSGSDCK